MARMFPPNGPLVWTQSDAERKIYHLLEKALDDEFIVFQSVAFHLFKENKTRLEREADYIIVHPKYGLIILEVKAHKKIMCEGQGKWYILNSIGVKKEINDPVHQVSEEEHALKRYLAGNSATRNFRYQTIRSLWFPLATWGHRQIPGLASQCILDKNDLSHPQQSLMQVFQQQNACPLRAEAIDALISAFAGAFRLDSSLASEIMLDEMAITSLTQEQFSKLERMRYTHRLLIPGAAGTGKTILTYEAAWRVADSGNRVLLLNYTSLQADWLREMLLQNPKSTSLRLDIHDLHSLARDLGKRSKTPAQEIANCRIDSNVGQLKLSHYLNKCQQSLSKNREIAETEWKYDAIFVDEGQDFEKPIWDELFNLLIEPDGGLFYVFYDEAQRIDFSYTWVFPGKDHTPEFRLQTNIRNSKHVFDLMQQFNPGRANVQQSQFAIEGRAVEYIDTKAFSLDYDSGTEAALFTILKRLIHEEGITPRQILIITCRPQNDSRYSAWMVKDYPIKAITRRKKDSSIGVSTIRSAKGLESDIVIVAELDGLISENPAKRSKLLYAAISRAKHHLIVLGTEKELFSHSPMQMTLL